MKKLLSLLLAMILCLGVLVACDDLTLHENEEPNVGEGRWPIFQTIFENRYVCYIVGEKSKNSGTNEKREDFERWIFDDYTSLISFLKENTTSNGGGEITQETFEENFIVVVYRVGSGSLRTEENYGYGNFKWNKPEQSDGYCSITVEYTKYVNKAWNDADVPSRFDIVVVPKEDGPQDFSGVADNFRIIKHIHRYEEIVEWIE